MGLTMKSTQTKLKVLNIKPSTQEEEETAPVTGHVYEELQFRDLT